MTAAQRPLLQIFNRTSLVLQIFIGLLAGIALVLLWPEAANRVSFLGTVFVSALKAVAPVLVFILVTASIANHQRDQQTHIRPILLLYLFGVSAYLLVALCVASVVRGYRRLHPSKIAAPAEGGDTPTPQLMERITEGLPKIAIPLATRSPIFWDQLMVQCR